MNRPLVACHPRRALCCRTASGLFSVEFTTAGHLWTETADISKLISAYPPQSTYIIRVCNTPQIGGFLVRHAETLLEIIANMGVWREEQQDFYIVGRNSQELVGQLVSLGAQLFWDEDDTDCSKKRSIVSREIMELPKPGTLLFQPHRPLPSDTASAICIARRSRVLHSVQAAIFDPLVRFANHENPHDWPVSDATAFEIGSDIFSYGHCGKWDVFQVDSEVWNNIPDRMLDKNLFSLDTLSSGYPKATESFDYEQQLLDLNRIWKEVLYGSDRNVEKMKEKKNAFQAAVQKIMRSNSSQHFSELVEAVGRELGIDYMIDAYFNGVPIDIILS